VILFAELLYIISSVEGPVSTAQVTAKQVGLTLFGPYVLAVEIASMLLLAGLVGSYHLGRRALDRNIDEADARALSDSNSSSKSNSNAGKGEQ
jgi:NADH-quinone oxidoreductase subunit J